MHGHRNPVVNAFFELGHRMVLGAVYRDHALEEVAQRHRCQRHRTNHHRRDGQQDQRHGDHGRRLVRLGIVAMAVVVVMRMMVVVVRIGVLVVALLAVEHDEIQAERVERGDEHTRQHGEVGEASSRQVGGVHRFDDRILGVEAREERRADQREVAQQEGEPGNRHVLAHVTHPADVLIVVHTHDHGTGTKEQQRLEERVRHQVEHGHRVGGHTQRNGHVTQLRERGVRDHALDVVLDDAQDTHEQRGDGADHEDQVQRHIRQFIQRRHARDHEDTGGHHGRRVNQRGDRCRAFHRIRQPGVQRELRRLAHRAHKQADGGHRHQQPARTGQQRVLDLGQLGEDFRIVQRAGVGSDQANAEDEAEVTHTVDQEGLHVGEDRGFLLEVEADQQIRHQAHCFPAEEQLQQVVGHHQHQHGEGEQRDVREEAVVAVVFRHVAHGVDVHHQRHKGHHAHHHRGQAVDQEAHFHLQAAHLHPGVDGLVEGGAFKHHLLEHKRGQHERQQHAQNRQRTAAGTTDLVAAKRGAPDTRQG
ncbi:hypothetical protein SDC9_101547 [bioreactor metagenome]|uniref:Uncharacterized protein n=1 Tax=bioreactor metagenome TaxID=1076179 RepID=A0A645AP00_9ZZZZ